MAARSPLGVVAVLSGFFGAVVDEAVVDECLKLVDGASSCLQRGAEAFSKSTADLDGSRLRGCGCF